jgi:GTPase SAR1 family protein
VESYINNILDKKVKVVFVGRKGVGKTSLIKSMNNMPSDRTRHTISIDFLSVTRTVGELRVQYSLWDTVSQSTIF